MTGWNIYIYYKRWDSKAYIKNDDKEFSPHET